VDVLPTLAAVAGAKVPQSYPGREPAPPVGISLVPVLSGKPPESRPPIHLLFGSDRALRDGDWKIVSFRSQPWELYNIAQDRTERHNLAGTHPEITARLVKLWHETTATVLQAPPKEREPVAAAAEAQRHREWSDYTGGADTSSRKGSGSPQRRTKNQK
jgi:arylsulfatase A-like enzyme